MNSEINFDRIKKDFPILDREIKPGVPLVYLDSTATAQKPLQVITAMDEYYRHYNGNIHRGVHTLAEEATAGYEAAREKIARFINAKKARQIIYTRNTTESINLVAQTWGRSNLKNGDLVILTEMEHHSNLVPWQILSDEKGLRLEFIPVDDNGQLDLQVFESLLAQEPKLLAFTHMSNVLGTINPAKEMVEKAKAAGAVTLIDGAQSVPHFAVDAQELGVDFLVFSAHKMIGPTGIGILYGKEEILDRMPPYQGGGDMIKKVYLRSFTANELPYKFEAGTPAIAEAIGFGAAIDYLSAIGMKSISDHEQKLVTYALAELSRVPGLKVIGEKNGNRGGVTSFTMEGIHPHDIAQILDQDGIAVRAGHHCAMPLHERFHLPATTRASYYLYNNTKDVEKLGKSLLRIVKMFNG
jgi:cysteine desulfurase/selenocysteine lyase